MPHAPFLPRQGRAAAVLPAAPRPSGSPEPIPGAPAPGPPGPGPRRPLRARRPRKLPGGGRDSSTGALFAHGARWHTTPSPRSGGHALPRTDSPIKKTAFFFFTDLLTHGSAGPLAPGAAPGVLSRLVRGLDPAGPLTPGAAPGEGLPRAPPCLGFRRAVWGLAAAPPPRTASPMPRASSHARARAAKSVRPAGVAPVPSVRPRPPRRHAHRVPAGHLPPPPPRAVPPPPAGHEKRPDALRRRGAWVLRRPGG